MLCVFFSSFFPCVIIIFDLMSVTSQYKVNFWTAFYQIHGTFLLMYDQYVAYYYIKYVLQMCVRFESCAFECLKCFHFVLSFAFVYRKRILNKQKHVSSRIDSVFYVEYIHNTLHVVYKLLLLLLFLFCFRLYESGFDWRIYINWSH